MPNALVGAISTVDETIHDKVVNEEAQKQTSLDKALKWAPCVMLMTYDAYGVKTRNNFKQHVLQIIAGQLMLNAAIRPIKKTINRTRPNGKGNSFPSAHTATAFLAAEIIRQELREGTPAFQYRGYALSMVTAWLRLYRNKHWLSDVVSGAITGAFFGKVASKLPLNQHFKQLK